ncbi:MAG: hypothetical protein Q7R39_11020 [Dehalococcoidia bacterium]|nr:hypothetical protein [Dehalococcoidia bacterium]
MAKKYTFIKLGAQGYGVLVGDRKDCWRETGYPFFSREEPVLHVDARSHEPVGGSAYSHLPESFDLDEVRELLEDPDPSIANYF